MIFFKFAGEDFRKYGGPKEPVGWIATRDYGVFNDGTPLLSQECASVEQIEIQATLLKREIDEAVEQAKRKLPKSK
jgi:hypothetical protein